MTVDHDITLIMTVLNEERGLVGFLESLAKQKLSPGKIVVVDGGSTDGTVRVLRSWAEGNEQELDVVIADGINIAAGRNLALSKVETPFAAITDAGTYLRSDWLMELRHAMSPSVDVVSGFFDSTGDTRFERRLAAIITPILSEIDASSFLPSSRSLLIRTDWWAKVGGYPEWLDYCEDLVFDLALVERGARFAFAPNAVVTWRGRSDLKSYFKQYYRYARGDGKAGLWPKRHAARYLTYLGVGAALVSRRGRMISPPLLIAGYAVYGGKSHRRLVARREGFPAPAEYPLAHLLTPVYIVVGDFAKMIGYPAGLIWRRRFKQG